MKPLADLLANVIPTKWSQASAVVTLVITPLAYNAPSHLPPTWLPNSLEQIFLIRLLLSETTLLLGSLLTLGIVIYAHNECVKRKDIKNAITEPNDNQRLEPIKEKILTLLAIKELKTQKQIAHELNITEQLTRHHLDALFVSKHIKNALFMDGRATQWSINAAGRAYQVKHGLPI